MQADFKGIDVGYDAVRHARAPGARASISSARRNGSPRKTSRRTLAAEFHVALRPTDGRG